MLHRQGQAEKSEAKRLIVVGSVAVAAIVAIETWTGGWFGGAFLDGIQRGDFSMIWTPPDVPRRVETLIVSVLLPASALIFLGISTFIEDREVRTHTGPGPVWNPVSVSITFPATALLIGGIVLAIRQVALLVGI